MKALRLLLASVLFGGMPIASAQVLDARYSSCDIHVEKSTICGTWRSRDGENYSSLSIRERNDTVGLTYISLECRGTGRMALYIESKNPLLTQADFDAELYPRVLYRIDNGSLRTLPVSGALEVGENEETHPDLNTLAVDEAGTLLQALASARQRVAITIERRGFSPLTYDFPVFGLEMAMKAIRSCNPLN